MSVRDGDRAKRHRRRSGRHLAARCGAVLLALVAGYVSVASTAAYTLRDDDPARAFTLFRSDGRITALVAQRLAGIDATAVDRKKADELARLALRQDPTAVSAVSTLGLDTQLSGDLRGARRLFSYAQTLSRRDLQTQIWAIENAVGRGDVAGALHHYDIALRTSRNAPDLLFPILGTAIADPAVRTALIRTLRQAPVWRGAFIDYVSGNGADPQATASLFVGLRHSGVAVPPGADATIVSALMSRGAINAAWSYYQSVNPGADRRMTRDPTFTAVGDVASPFDWETISDGGITTSIQRGDRGDVLDFVAPSGTGGPVVQQVQLLPPGRYRLVGHSSGINLSGQAAPHWNLNCRDGRELGRLPLPDSSVAGGRFVGDFLVPASCSIQTLTLVVEPSDAVGGVTGQIDRAYLAPVGRE